MIKAISDIQAELDALGQAGTYKSAPVIESAMGPTVTLRGGRDVVNLCSNNYLGLANDAEVLAGARQALEEFGYGTASVRFICGSFAIHERLEESIADWLAMEAATAYVSCWNANEALAPTLLRAGDAVISDELNHASIIDACRLCNKKVNRLIYKHSDMASLAEALAAAAEAPRTLIFTDGVFSMEGDLANLPEIVALASRHDALVAVDDSHAHGVVGATGRGTPEHFGVAVDIVTGTLGKALGGAAGGFVAAARPVIELLVQRSRPQLFSNALPPMVAGGGLAAIELVKTRPQLLDMLRRNATYLRDGLKKLDYEVMDSPSAIVPIIVGDTARAISMAEEMLKLGVLITGFGFPVVPEGAARLRAQISAAHTTEHLSKVIEAFRALREA